MFHILLLAFQVAAADPTSDSPPDYTLGPDDQLLIRVLDVEEFSEPTPTRIDAQGQLNLPLLGQVPATGLTTEALEADLEKRLRSFVKQPHVKVRLVSFRSAPVSILGSVNQAGVQQIRGRKTLYEVLSQAGGLRPDAGDTITITRPKSAGPLPLANTRLDDSGQFQIGEVNARDLLSARSPLANIVIQPNDVISIPRAELVYVMGEVVKAGGFVLDNGGPVTLLQALSLAGGPQKMGNLGKARILRLQPGTATRQEIAIDLKKVLDGKDEDVRMKPEDILYIPHNTAKAVALRSIEMAAGAASMITIWRVGNPR
ncbi:MAG: polysaccharide biosynthesis/export family protein [Bryobacterales bacterium]|nr:polysaccharide biosynthesis/export family protein [Bryobacterales bacterium]